MLIAFDKGLRQLLDAEVAGGGMGGGGVGDASSCHNGLTLGTEGQIIVGYDLQSTTG